MSEPTPLITVRDASVSFGPVPALRDVDLAVHDGDTIAIVGANGSGKTTLLRLLHGVVGHTGTRAVAPAAVRQAMVFQRPFLLRLSVRNNLRIALWLGRDADDPAARRARATEALARVGLAPLAMRPARSLSGGEQQRLALARAWAVRPRVLFLDEPTANLDPGAKREIEALLSDFIADGMTVVFSTHNLGQAKRLATRVIYLEEGRVEADETTADFFARDRAGKADVFLKGELSW